MEPEDFLEAIEKIKTQKQGNRRAPHKPLLLLLALGRVAQDDRDESRLASYSEELKEPLVDLLHRFDPGRQTLHPVSPFWRLRNDDGLWEIPGSEELRAASGNEQGEDRDPSEKDLRNNRIKGGFSKPVYKLLKSNPELVQEAAKRLLYKYFSDILHMHTDIRQAVGLPQDGEQWVAPASQRNPRFRTEVLRAYQFRCAVCGFDIRLDNNLLGIEAAHIKWRSEGGPDEVKNGLALCSLHHKALDYGAFCFEQVRANEKNYRFVVSERVNGSGSADELRKLNGKPLEGPKNDAHAPAPEYIDWHRQEIFR